jgi:hypothetical protein
MSKRPWRYSQKRLAALRVTVSNLGDRIEELNILAYRNTISIDEAKELGRLEVEMYHALIDRDNCELGVWQKQHAAEMSDFT